MIISQNLDEKQTISLHKKPAYNNISNETKKQLEEINEHENKIKNKLLEKIYMFENENKMLTEKNKSFQSDLNVLKPYLKDVENDRNNWKSYYKKLQSQNKYLLNKQEVKGNDDADSLKELPKKKRPKTNKEVHTNQLYSKY